MLILNDLHIGFDRKGGTTAASKERLRSYLLNSAHVFLSKAAEHHRHLVVAGDLFDDFEVSSRDLLAAYSLLTQWLDGGLHKLTLVAGNHDWRPNAERVSSFQLLCRVLRDAYPDQIQLVMLDSWGQIDENVYAIAHYSNQAAFEAGLKEVWEEMPPGSALLVHANYENKFAARADHSLNISEDLAKSFAAHDITLYFAHEHQAKKALGGKVVILGNQWPTSVADCLGNDAKFAHTLTVDSDFGGEKTHVFGSVETWGIKYPGVGFNDIDWRELPNTPLEGHGFVRIVGNASATEASDVVNAIAHFRAVSDAFVISNETSVAGIVGGAELPEAFEATKRFDVLKFIAEHLDDREMVVVNQLISEQS